MATKQKDYYGILGLKRDADEKQIKRAYRRLARKHHPDLNPNDHSAEDRFKAVQEAYEVLGDPEKRARFDQFGHLGDAWRYAQPGPGGAPPGGGLGDVFERLFRSGGPARARGRDLRTEVVVSLGEAYRGTSRSIAVPVPETCPTCRGTRLGPGNTPCPTCGGHGRVERPKRLTVKIPPGVDEGSRIRVAGEGGAGVGDAPPGDLYLITKMARHAFFEREGDDLRCEAPVTFAEAALGAKVDLPTMTGRVKVTVPPGSSSGRVLRLTGQGMPRLRGQGHGDLYVRLRIVVPENLTEEEKKLIGQLAERRHENPRAHLPSEPGA
jgi:DnaJ-class molecular chaperone